MSAILGWVAAALYGVAAWQLWRAVNGLSPEGGRVQQRLPIALALVAHAASVAVADDMNLGIANALSLTTWAMVLTLLCLSARHPVESLGVVVLPLAALVVAAVPLLQPHEAQSIDSGVWVHVWLSLTAYGLLCLAAAQACLVAWHTARLRRAPGAAPSGLPPLATLERLMFHLLSIGLAVLTAAIASGFVFLEDMFAQQVAHKTVFSLLAWAVFAALLGGHWLAGWRGKTAVRWTLIGMALLLVGFFGSKLVLEVLITPAG